MSVYEADAGHGDWGEYHRPQAATDTLTFTAPAANGSYEMRLYSADPGDNTPDNDYTRAYHAPGNDNRNADNYAYNTDYLSNYQQGDERL